MRLLTHNALRNNSADAKGKGYPLRIVSAEVRVDDSNNTEDGNSLSAGQQISFVKSVLPTMDWNALVTAANEVGIPTLPPVLTEDLASDVDFLRALYQILMHVHLVKGTLTCPATGRQFVVSNGIPNMILEEEECERVRY